MGDGDGSGAAGRVEDADDPRGLVREALRMDLSEPECRTVFLDWALGLGAGRDPRSAAQRLLARHGEAWPDHPMIRLLHEAAETPSPSQGRRGGRARFR